MIVILPNLHHKAHSQNVLYVMAVISTAVLVVFSVVCQWVITSVFNSAADVSCTTEVVQAGKFKWQTVIIGILQQAPDRQLRVKKLRKKASCLILEWHRN